MNLHAVCYRCKHQHKLKGGPYDVPRQWDAWQYRHAGHEIDLTSINPSVTPDFLHNADVNIKYTASAGITCGVDVTPLASSATFVAGRESTVIDNTSNFFVDAVLGGQIAVGTTPTIDTQIRIYIFVPINSTPTYPDVMGGTDADKTLTSVGVGAGFLKLAKVLDVDSTTSNRGYDYSGISIAQLFGGTLPSRWSLFVAHNTGVALNTTASNHDFDYEGVEYTVV